jgi:UDP-N-acetylmuramate dehydrogenase
MALGGGNNILFTKDFDGTLVKSAAQTIEITAETPETLSVRAGAGVVWDDLVAWCVERGVWGAENLSAIPGTVGAAPVQNIGAYGAEVKDIIGSVECFDIPTGKFTTLAAEHLGLGYRDSVFKRSLKGRTIVTAASFTLSKVARPNLRYAPLNDLREPTLDDIRRTVMEIRADKLPDPAVQGNAGSFFKNPVVPAALAHTLAATYPDIPLYPAGDGSAASVGPGETEMTKLSAGWLIEQAGWKGRTEGRVGIHPRQALIVVNTGGATGSEVVEFARRVAGDVYEKFGVELSPEVIII